MALIVPLYHDEVNRFSKTAMPESGWAQPALSGVLYMVKRSTVCMSVVR